MSALSTDRKPPLDYGVQIRFIKDLHDTGGGYPEKTRGVSRATLPSNKYGVAVRVQGISGQPYVVLKDGEKGDSYGVQLKTQQAQPQNPNSGLSSPYNSLPQRKERGDDQSPYALTEQTLSSLASPVSTPEDEGGEDFGSPFKRPPGDGQAGSQGEGEGGPPIEGQAERVSIKVKEEPLPTAAEPYRVVMKERGCVKWEEFNEAGLKPVSPRGAKQNGVGPGGSLGRNGLDSSFPEPLLPMSFNEEPVPAIDKTSLAPINKLISKFNIGTPNGQTRGRSGARLRLKFDERRRSRSLDARKEEVCSEVSPSSPTPNPYASSPLFSSSSTSSTPPYISLGWSPASVAKVTALPGPKPSFIKSAGKFVVKDTPPAIPPKKARMPAPLRDHRGQSLEVISGEDPQTKQAVYTILKEGTSESDVSVKRKDNLVYEKSSGAEGRPKPVSHGNLKEELEQSLKENLQLQEQLDLNKTELQQAQEELIQLRMAREGVESRVRQQEDLLAELQEELRGISENTPQTDSDVMSLQADLAEASMLRQRQEEVLRQRERELTALKGALKEEVGSHDQEMESLREQYSLDMETLRSTMEQVSQSQQQIEEERQRVNDSMLCLEEELESCRDQGGQWREQLETASEELHSTKQELMRARLEKEAFEGELKALQDSLMSMKKRMPGFDKTDSSTEDLLHCHDDIKQARTELDKQKVELNEKEELQALRRASQARESELRSEIDRLKDQSRQEKDELEMALEKAKQSSGGSSPLDQGSLELLEANTRLRERLARMTRLHFSVPQSSEAEKALEDENHSLRSQLEEARRGASRLGKERDELCQRLEERDLERDALRRGKSDLEEQKRLLDRALEKISKEMEVMLGDSRQSVQTMQSQLDEYRERSRRDLQDAQRQGKDRLAELQRAQANLKTLQEEVSRLKKELVVCGEERDSTQLETDLFSSRLKHLESELDSERSSQTDRNREIRSLEDKVKTMEIELDEEKSSVELLNDRVARSREQIDQLRGDLMKERSTVHDLEMDKSVLERQVKELRSRVADMETQSRPSAGITLLEGKVLELEERLRSEEREKLSIQASQRRVERKLKDVIVTLDQERNQHAKQRDQLSLRVKALKRQLDESEGEVERLEGVRRKALRDLEEQQEALQAKVTALESEKRKVHQTRRPVLGSSNLSSEDEEGFYDNSITSILTEGQLHTTNC